MVYKYMRSRASKKTDIKDQILYSILMVSFVVYFIALNVFIVAFGSFMDQFIVYCAK